MPTVSVLLTTFQFASTALTVTLNGVPAVCAGRRPGLAGRRAGRGGLAGHQDCSFANAPAITVIAALVFAVFVPSVMSVAVTVYEPCRLQRDAEGLRAGDQRRIGRQRRVRVARRDADRVGDC